MNNREFQKIVKEYYRVHGRALPWRVAEPDGSLSAYKILVSEFMLQQTQVSRVVSKYTEFLEQFPSLERLAEAPLAEVLRVWSGLGYNRRAQYVHQAARSLLHYPQPWGLDDLISQKGIGSNTAAAISVYAYNHPQVFIETNIRSVYLHHYFSEEADVADSSVLEIVHQTLDTKDPRTWYWALMDYGTYLKTQIVNPNQRSKHYVKQSTFAGSPRQLRGAVLRELLRHDRLTYAQLEQRLTDARLAHIVQSLQHEGLISKRARNYTITK